MAGKINPTKKPDCDNIVRITYDVLNGITNKDDQKITLAQIRKKYADIHRVGVRLMEA